MKAIICEKCGDIVVLRLNKHRTCECGASFGRYLDTLNAYIGGSAIPLGFTNSSLLSALRARPLEGQGSQFTAFVIPFACPTISYAQTTPENTLEDAQKTQGGEKTSKPKKKSKKDLLTSTTK